MDTERASLVSFTIPQDTAVLVVDVQPMFTNKTLIPPVDEVLPRLRRFLDGARTAGVLRVFIRTVISEARWTEPWRQQFSPAVQADNAPGSPLNAYHADFEPEPGDLTLVKDRYSAFMSTELETLLRERGIRTVIVMGLITDVCVSSTARDAFQLDFLAVTLSDCTATSTLARHKASLATIAGSFGRVCTSEEVLAAWQAQPALAAAQAS